MDPEAALHQVMAHLAAHEMEEAWLLLGELRDWQMRGGFIPRVLIALQVLPTSATPWSQEQKIAFRKEWDARVAEGWSKL